MTEIAVLSKTATIHDTLIILGSPQHQCRHQMRLVRVLFRGKWYRYLTNVLTPTACHRPVLWLCTTSVGESDAFNAVKRLLGLAYFPLAPSTGSDATVGHLVALCSPWWA